MRDVTKNINIDFVEKLKPLFAPAPYKIAWGGRGGAKTLGFAQASLLLAARKPLRVGCFREVQNSLKESVHQQLSNEIDRLQLVTANGKPFYEVQDRVIKGANGSEFFFMGLRRNIDSVKSVAAIDIAWVEEANSIPDPIWNKFEPTIRGGPPMGPFGLGPEIWIGFNPEMETDATYKRFVLDPPPGAVLMPINYWDNKFFPDNLRQQMEHMKKRDYQAYLNVWEGKCRASLDGAIFASQIANCEKEGRITRVSYDKSKPVYTFWDLGIGDATAIWFVQKVGMDFNIIDFEQDVGKDITDWISVLKSKEYEYSIHYLPHDGGNRSILNKRSAQVILKDAGFRCRLIPRVAKKAMSINAARVIFDQCYFDRDKTVVGMQALRRYKYDVDKDTGEYSKEPLHDMNSNAADAFQQLALSQSSETEDLSKKKIAIPGRVKPLMASDQHGWMT